MIQKLAKKLGKKKSGFTLIELIIVIAILGILAAILVPTVGGYINSANNGRGVADCHQVYTAAAAVIASNPNTTYLSKGFTGTVATGQHVFVDSDLTTFIATPAFVIDKIDVNNGALNQVEITENSVHYFWSGSGDVSSSH